MSSCFLFSLFQNVYPLFLNNLPHTYSTIARRKYDYRFVCCCVHQKRNCVSLIYHENDVTVIYLSKKSDQLSFTTPCYLHIIKYNNIYCFPKRMHYLWSMYMHCLNEIWNTNTLSFVQICICSDINIIGKTQKNSSFAWLNCKKINNCARHTSTF